MRFTKTIIEVVLVITISSNAAGQIDINDLSEYYGFDEMEVIKLERGINSLRIADFNGDGRKDIAIVNNIKARIELLIQKETIGPGDAEVAVDPNDIDINALILPTRFESDSVPISQRIFSFVCGDLNSDGMIDLAFYGDPKGLYVILQKAGEAEAEKSETLSWQTRRKIKIDDGLSTVASLVCADLNNDAADDLALAGRDCVYVILQKADGTLAEPVKYAAVAQVLGLEAGDLNGDKINDLILLTNNIEKPIHVRFGLETGQLGPQQQFFIERPWALEPVNIDKTDSSEILTIDAKSGRLICYKFADEKDSDADWPILFYPLITGEESTKRDLAVCDFDGDGLVDVAISDPGTAELIFYKQTKDLGLAEPVRFPAFADITNLSASDVDGDAKPELAVLSIKEKVIGISEFEDERFSFPKPVELTGEPVAMELADADGDGYTDCLYVSRDTNDLRSMRIIYNVGATDRQSSDDMFIVELKKLTSNPDGLKVLDVDQDGLQDVLIFIKYEVPILARQTETRVFEIIDSPKAQASLIKDASLHSIDVADMDGHDGKELLVAQKNFARSLVFADGQSWSIIDQYNAKGKENEISAVAAFDIDDEGREKRPAILLLDGQKGQLQVLKAGEDKTYRLEKELDVGKWSTAVHLKMLFEPLTGSELKSILLFDSEKFALITPPSGSKPQRNLQQQFSYETKIKDGVYGNLTAGDINSDGRPDIIMVEYKRNHFEILALDSQYKPVPAMRFKIFEEKGYSETGSSSRPRATVEPRELKIADVTNDGKDDLVTVIHDRIIIYPQD